MSNDLINQAECLINENTKGKYFFGNNILSQLSFLEEYRNMKCVVVRSFFNGSDLFFDKIKEQLKKYNISIIKTVKGCLPNTPLSEVNRIKDALIYESADFVLSFGGGSTIDCVKAAIILKDLGGQIQDYFGTKKVSEKIKVNNKTLTDHVSFQTLASSSAHLTKYANVTMPGNISQKKLIVDESIIPTYSIFDYSITNSVPWEISVDGAMDGISHSLEVLYGSKNNKRKNYIHKISKISLELIIYNLSKLAEDTTNQEYRKSICLGCDLGGIAIMMGGTNGGHLTSFSLGDIATHAKACGILNPYYSVFFAPEIKDELNIVYNVLKKYGYCSNFTEKLSNRDFAVEVSKCMHKFYDRIKFPKTLQELDGFSMEYISHALKEASRKELSMKLENMPISMSTKDINTYMKNILLAAINGNFNLIKNK